MMKFSISFLFFASLVFVSCTSKNHSQGEMTGQDAVGIVNGDRVKPSDPIAKQIVAITDESLENCTGTLIAENLVLTAAHCETPDVKMYVAFGLVVSENNVNQIDLHEVTDYRLIPGRKNINPDFQVGDHLDLMIVKFEGKAPAGYVPAEFLPDPSVLVEGALVTVAGYGVTNGASQKGDGFLRKTLVSIHDVSFSKTEISTDETRNGSCSIDSGGPAFIDLNGKTYIWGVISRGDEKCREEGIYTKISSHMDWINTTIKELSSSKSK